jgi:threonine synthase
VLDEFFKTGVYRVRGTADTHETSSPSMDISKASNFERFVFDLLQRDAERVKNLFHDQLNQTGQFNLGQDPLFAKAKTQFGFLSGKSTHVDRLKTIQEVFATNQIMIDTHTADGLKVAVPLAQAHVPMLVLETALPIKFAATLVEALGREPNRPAKFEGIEALPKRVTLMPKSVDAVKAFIVQHCD